jgi:S-(hydroxymethyl)glutathione dehydrogenase / alcohol dehydrogenase
VANAQAVRAAVFSGPGEVAIEELELEEPRRGEVLVRLGASGVCHSDLHVVDGDWPRPAPVVMGHEGAGVIEAVGEDVRDVAVGDSVVLSWFYSCRRCESCMAGRAWMCTGTRAGESVMEDGTTRFRRADGQDVFTYVGVGSMAERTVVPESGAIRVPAEVPAEVAALIGCAVTTGVGAVLNTAQVPPGASVVVIGAGGVGLSAIMGAALAGAEPIVAVERAEAKHALALEVGATHAVTSAEEAREVVGGAGADFAFEAIGLVETIEALPGLLRPGGTAVLIGMPPYGVRASFDVYPFIDTGKALVGSIYGGSVPAVEFPRLAALYLAGKLPVDKLVSHRIGLDDLDDAFEAMRRAERARSVIVF